MIKLEMTGVHMELDDKLRRYVTKKIGGIEKYMSRRLAENSRLEVILRTEKKGDEKYTVEVTMHLPAETLVVKESTINMYAAVDIADAKLKNQLKKYKDTHINPRAYRKIFAKLRRSQAL